MSTKTTARNMVIVVLILGALGFTAFNYSKQYSPTAYSDTLHTPTNFTEIQEESDYFKIKAIYPTEGLGASEVGGFILKEVESFKNFNLLDRFKELSDWEQQEFDAGNIDTYSLDISYKIATNAELITYVVYIEYYSGGATRGLDVHTFTYNKNGAKILLNDIFVDSEAIPLLEKKIREKAIEFLGDFTEIEMLDSGINLSGEKPIYFYITNEFITFIFPPAVIAPASAGKIELTLNLYDFRKYLNREYIDINILKEGEVRIGIMKIGESEKIFLPCRTNKVYWYVDKTKSLEKKYEEVHELADTDVYMKVRGISRQKIGTDPKEALDYDGVFEITEIIETSETSLCKVQ